MSTARHALRSQNSFTLAGQLGWGWRISADGRVERDDHEEQIVAVARHMRASGATLREIVEFLRDQGIVGRRGTPIGTTRVFEMIHGGRRKPKSIPQESIRLPEETTHVGGAPGGVSHGIHRGGSP